MFKSVILLALVALAVATPAPKPEEKKDLKTDESLGLGYGLGYAGVYGAYPSWGYDGAWDSAAWGTRGWGARSLWGGYPYSATYDPYYYPYNGGLWY